jgi:hypothetical protein
VKYDKMGRKRRADKDRNDSGKMPRLRGNEHIKEGQTAYSDICNNKECPGKSFMLEYAYNGWKHGIDGEIVKMTANACGIRDSARVLEISKQKVCDTLKKRKKR